MVSDGLYANHLGAVRTKLGRRASPKRARFRVLDSETVHTLTGPTSRVASGGVNWLELN